YLSRSFSFLLFSLYGDLRDLHSFPTRRSSDLDGSNGVSRMLLWRSVMDPRIHLLIIDPQNDFCDVPPDERPRVQGVAMAPALPVDRKSTRLNSSHVKISYAVFCLKKKKIQMKSRNMKSIVLRIDSFQVHYKLFVCKLYMVHIGHHFKYYI